MSDDAPPVRPWSEVRAERELLHPRRRKIGPDDSLRDYIDDQIAHRQANPPPPDVQIGYAHLKRRG